MATRGSSEARPRKVRVATRHLFGDGALLFKTTCATCHPSRGLSSSLSPIDCPSGWPECRARRALAAAARALAPRAAPPGFSLRGARAGCALAAPPPPPVNASKASWPLPPRRAAERCLGGSASRFHERQPPKKPAAAGGRAKPPTLRKKPRRVSSCSWSRWAGLLRAFCSRGGIVSVVCACSSCVNRHRP